jgi:hypothetical protein
MSISTSDESPELEGPGPFGSAAAGVSLGDGMPGGAPDGGGPAVSCTHCGAALDPAQRYCVECGLHRIGVNDPAAAYMNRQPAAGARATRAVIVSSRQSRWITALVLALIPVAVGQGVLVGRASNNQDAALLKAARSHAIITVPGKTSVVTISAGGRLSGVTATTAASKSSTTASGGHTGSAAVGAKTSAAQKAQSAKIVQKLQTSTGASYLDPLPSQVGGG